jgi:hypothetical protein
MCKRGDDFERQRDGFWGHAIDTSTNTIYLVTKTKESGVFFQRLHAIDMVTHAEKFGSPKVISASVPGSGDGSTGAPSSTTVSFDPLLANQRFRFCCWKTVASSL